MQMKDGNMELFMHLLRDFFNLFLKMLIESAFLTLHFLAVIALNCSLWNTHKDIYFNIGCWFIDSLELLENILSDGSNATCECEKGTRSNFLCSNSTVVVTRIWTLVLLVIWMYPKNSHQSSSCSWPHSH